ncbi:hypothetical protein [Aeromicrobium choanae]|uniref:Uncharacterized protein n=1 Tax=Aeromicrobium choanae TaxID=1736691 RepID=A0A1T4Z7S3_9ACTN|nr:hypothetical protein [Aeromicrobium choanae]SKB10100.1 hypothetical protein SAMN06295964_3100 [Aeromicrobium choanae]
MDARDLDRWQEHGREHGYIRARLRLLTTEQGGRQGAIHSGYRSCWGFPLALHADMHDGPLLIERREILDPGEVAIVCLHPLFPEFWPEVSEGLPLVMFEGSRKVGEAVVIEVVPPVR